MSNISFEGNPVYLPPKTLVYDLEEKLSNHNTDNEVVIRIDGKDYRINELYQADGKTILEVG